jgi:hypothetical protein
MTDSARNLLVMCIDKFSPGFLIAVVLIVVAAILWITTTEIPSDLYNLLTVVVAFYFGETSARYQASVVNGMARTTLPNCKYKGDK